MYINNHSYGAKEPTHQEFTWSKSLAATLGALTMKSWTTEPMKASARIAFYRYFLLQPHYENFLCSKISFLQYIASCSSGLLSTFIGKRD